MSSYHGSAKSTEAKDVPPPVALDRCPSCRYSLEGLPAAHRCPECGFLYDEQTRVWYAKSFWKFGGIILVLAATQAPQSLGRIFEKSPQQFAFWLNVGLVFMWVGFLIALIIRYRAHPFVAVGPSGVTYKTNQSLPVTVPWDEVVAVDLGLPKKFRYVRLKVTTATKPIELTNIISMIEPAQEFQRCVEERKAPVAESSPN